MHTPLKLILTSWICLLSACATLSREPAHREQSEIQTPYSWVELGPQSQAIARIITGDSQCPPLILDSIPVKMESRSSPSSQFPVQVCEKQIPEGIKTAQIGKILLPIPKVRPKRILILGDTGCRVRVLPHISLIQACNNPDAWPFAEIAKVAANWNPDWVLHMGDYLYRESPCPEGNAECAGSPVGDSWASWKADFFDPARKLLEAAPWVVVRGNHELCSRGGQGWFNFLDPRALPAQCQDLTDPYWVKAGPVQMVVLDSAFAEDQHPKPEDIAEYSSQLQKMQAFPNSNKWLLTHRPFWGYAWSGSNPSTRKLLPLNLTLQAAAEKSLPQKTDLIFSGHIHLAGVTTYADSGPTQWIVGNGGTELNELPDQVEGLQVGKRIVKSGMALKEFGFLTLEAGPRGRWNAVIHDRNGKSVQNCSVLGSHVSCK